MSLRIGTSGWSYPSGKGTWNGLFYPPRKGRGSSVPAFDELTWYAEHFDTVEVNSSFYGPPTPETTRKWTERTPAGFEFCLKLHQQFTHPAMYKKAALSDLPDQSADVLAALATVTAADVGRFKDGLEPLAVRGRLGALLAQFPPSFHDTPANREYLDWLLATFAEYPVAVELRHKTWSDRHGETLALLGRHHAAWTQIDEPKFRFSIRQNGLPNQDSVAYMRLHGRNAAQWWRHDAAEDRYNYLYSSAELEPIAETAVATKAIVKKAYLFLNNHFASKAVVNAVVLKHLIGAPITGTYPPEMVERYPELDGLVEIAPFTASRTFFE
ncbi:MAG: DUF72 domain-containing protein [Vicinamibacteria bacterium]|nr:DUF72 domain-containing protein [Vicinamibacteria bacterium]